MLEGCCLGSTKVSAIDRVSVETGRDVDEDRLSGGFCEPGHHHFSVFESVVEEGTLRRVTNLMYFGLEEYKKCRRKVWEDL